ncbi:MAG TPA: GNAT family N-acetyltransferase [Nocardioides sp.]|nr:GNAT family N-acetyltransferase [Nocardioides sp.]
MTDVAIRPMQPGDVPVVERLSAEGFHELDVRTYQRDWPEPSLRSPERARAWEARTRHFLGTDPGGCWVAEGDDGIVGFATSVNRELMWILASYAVRPHLQGQGIGLQLLAAALHHGRGCLRGMLAASSDPKAVRRYRLAGFDLHPQMLLWGTVPRAVIPVVDRVRDGSPADVDLMDSIDRRTRGAAHGSDHELLLREFRLLVADRGTGSGYVYADGSGAPVLLAATNRRTATDLAWAALAGSDPDRPVDIAHVTAENQWLVDVGLAARMEVHQRGYLALRHMKPPQPYLHHGSFL